MSNSTDNGYLHVVHDRDAPIHRHRVGRHYRQCIIVVVLLFSALLNLAGALWTFRSAVFKSLHHPVHQEHERQLLTEDMLCCNCSVFSSLPGGKQSKVTQLYISTDDNLCCLSNAEALQKLSFVLSLHETLPNNTRSSSGVHLYINSKALRTEPPSIRWNDGYGYGAAYISTDISIESSAFRVHKPGLYYMYSLFTFTKSQQKNVFTHTIHRKRAQLPAEEILFMNNRAVSDHHRGKTTSFLSGTVRLDRFDQIYVQVSDISMIYKFGPGSYFGMFVLLV